MTVEEIKYKLKNDFPFLVTVIVSNNPDDVRRNLSAMIDGNYETVSSMVDTILQLHEVGQNELVFKALEVPFRVGNANTNLVKAWEQVKSEAGNISSGGMRTAVTEGETTGGGFASWSGGMFSAIGQIGSAWLGSQGGGGTAPNSPVYVAPPQQQKNNTIWYILGAIMLIIIIVVMIFAFRKK